MKIKIIKDREFPELKKLYSEFQVTNNADICIAVGGDGTFIEASKEFDGPILPIRSGELGSTGYYADLGLGDIDFIVKNLKKHNYIIEHLSKKIEIVYAGKRYYAVNEALLDNARNEVSFKIYEVDNGKRNELYPYVMSGDGVLITSVIGSTAYNKSAGGPIILSPNVLCLTFLNVDGPYKNPIVVDANKELEIHIVKYEGLLRYDGIKISMLEPNASFRVKLSNKELSIVRFKGRIESFATKLDRIIKTRMIKDF